MGIELALGFIDAYLIALLIILIIYFIRSDKPLLRITFYILILELFSRAIFTSLLKLPYSEYIWYLTWASLAAFLVYILLKETKRHPFIQKVTLPITFLIFGVVVLEIGRYFERHYLDIEIFKPIYKVGSIAVNWLIIAYLFAPIALLLLNYFRGRFLTKH